MPGRDNDKDDGAISGGAWDLAEVSVDAATAPG
jgi:hypothetical protein